MKRTIVLLATLLLSFGLVSAANQVNAFLEWDGPGTDTVWVGSATRLVIQLENDVKLGGLSIGFELTTNDVITWTYDVQGTPDGATIITPGTLTLGGRMAPGGAVWDLGGFQFTQRSMDGVSPDSMLVGGAALGGGFTPGGFEDHVVLHFTPDGVTGDDKGTICFDSTYIPPAGQFLFIDEFAASIFPGYVPGDIVCLPVAVLPNLAPEFTNCPGAAINVNHCGQGSVDLDATDAEGDPFQFSVAGNTGSGAANVDANTGVLTYTPAPGELGSVTVTVAATDAFGSNTCDVEFNITNNAPTVTCGDAVYPVGKGNAVVNGDIAGADVDACDNLTFALINLPATVNAPSIDAGTGEFTWLTDDTEGGNTFTFEVEVSDGFTTATCTFDVDVLLTEPFEVMIEKVHGQLQGHYATLDIVKNLGSELMGGYDFLIGYDPSAISFVSAELGDMLDWEYFTYRYNYNGNCGNGCPSGLLRIVAIADINDGPNHPNDFTLPTGDAFASLTFLITNDRTLECMYVPVSFYWMDCGDNTISSKFGDTLFVSRFVKNYYGDDGIDTYVDVTDNGYGFPGYYGAPTVPCLDGDKEVPVRFIDFLNGGFDIICSDEIDARGDINVNGVVYEIADAVMYTNYFINGISAFGPTALDHQEASIAASDANADGLVLSVADLVYLVRVIVGDALPYPKPVPGASVELVAQGNNVAFNSDVTLGGALLVFEASGSVGEITVPGMDVKQSFENGELRVLVYSLEGAAMPEDLVLNIPTDGNLVLTEADLATYEGAVMDYTINNVPTEFDLAQNYPNPFNPTTTIAMSLPVESDWTLKIYNVAGQLVNEFTGHNAAGTVNVEWDGTNVNGETVASGIYFYKASADAFSATKKMVLMK